MVLFLQKKSNNELLRSFYIFRKLILNFTIGNNLNNLITQFRAYFICNRSIPNYISCW